MKNLNMISPFFLVPLLLGGMAVAQEAVNVVPEGPQPQNIVVTQQQMAANAKDSGRNDISQFGRYPQVHRGPIRSSGGRAYPSAYASAPPPPLSALGALIGFGVGAAIGASGSDHSGMTLGGRVIVGGALFALMGGAIGRGLPFRHRIRFPEPPDPGDDEESILRTDPKGVHKKRLISAAAKPRGAPTEQTGTLLSANAGNFGPNNRVAAFRQNQTACHGILEEWPEVPGYRW